MTGKMKPMTLPDSPCPHSQWDGLEEGGVVRYYCCECGHERDPSPGWTTKDSGARTEYPTGMVRDTGEEKARFDLLLAEGIPYAQQFATRVADLAYRGSVKYGDRNHEKSRTKEELDRMKSSAYRHLVQWIAGETDEDHAAAVAMNLFMAESCSWRMENE